MNRTNGMQPTINVPLTILEFIVALGFLAFLHELGHFLVAKLFKIEVEEFGFGFPPRLIRLFTLGGTDFTLNWIPFGAFVRPKGENNPEVTGGLAAASPWVRLAVLLGGSFTNLITGVFIFSMIFSQTGAPDPSRVMIIEVNQGSPSAQAGLMQGDIIQEINGQKIDNMEKLSRIVNEYLGEEISITFKRDDVINMVYTVPRPEPPQGEGPLGIVMSNPSVSLAWYQAIPLSVRVTYDQGKQLLLLPVRLILNQIPTEQARIVGPKGMYDIFQQVRSLDIAESSKPTTTSPAINTLVFLAIISIALGFTNLLPIPALDGGRILFVLPEIILRKRIPAQYENIVHFIGLSILIGLMFYITAQDIINPIVLP